VSLPYRETDFIFLVGLLAARACAWSAARSGWIEEGIAALGAEEVQLVVCPWATGK